eukprot:1136491-Pelagomonas_calceolata.AAC.2
MQQAASGCLQVLASIKQLPAKSTQQHPQQHSTHIKQQDDGNPNSARQRASDKSQMSTNLLLVLLRNDILLFGKLVLMLLLTQPRLPDLLLPDLVIAIHRSTIRKCRRCRCLHSSSQEHKVQLHAAVTSCCSAADSCKQGWLNIHSDMCDAGSRKSKMQWML